MTTLRRGQRVTCTTPSEGSFDARIVRLGTPTSWRGWALIARRRKDGEWSRRAEWWPARQMEEARR